MINARATIDGLEIVLSEMIVAHQNQKISLTPIPYKKDLWLDIDLEMGDIDAYWTRAEYIEGRIKLTIKNRFEGEASFGNDTPVEIGSDVDYQYYLNYVIFIVGTLEKHSLVLSVTTMRGPKK